MTNWYEIPGNENDVVVSSRVRLARNLADYPFEPRLTPEQAKEICEKLKTIYSDGWRYTDFSALSPAEKRSYGEKHLVSPAFAGKKTPCALFARNSVYIMALEEDHLRIQSIYPGLALDEAWHDAAEADRQLDENANVAYTEKLGYLTHCPTNLGSGMRASVMMFLPGLAMTGELKGIVSQLSKLGLTIRGIYGEGSEAWGYLYQISNAETMGAAEEATVSRLCDIVTQIIARERSARERIKAAGVRNYDPLCRALGILKYAHTLKSKEFIELYSKVRLGIAIGVIDEVDYETLDRLFVSVMPATLSQGQRLNESERDIKRAEVVKEKLSKRNE